MSIINTLLQIFADSGTRVVTTQNFVNAYTGATEAFDTANSMAGELKVYYDTELLENNRVDQVYAQFAKKQALPAGHGETVEFRKFNTFAKASKLTEGVIPTGQKFGMTSKTASIFQMGTYVALSDKIDVHAYDPVLTEATHEMSASMYETQETLIRDFLLTNSNEMWADNVTLATGAAAAVTANNAMEDTAAIKCYLTDKIVNRAVTALKKAKAPKINGKYVAVIHPSVAEDLRNCPGWLEAHKYAAPDQLFNGEIGELHGCRFIESPDAPVFKGTLANKAGGAAYATYFFGQDAFAIIDPAQGGAEMIIKDKEQAGGPLSQFSTCGYKFEFGGAVLYPERMLRVWSCSSYSGDDDANYDPNFYPAP